jgi:hypothetical protein
MKTLRFTALIVLLCLASSVKAQLSVNVTIGSPPMWGPVGYTDVRYYYIPAVESYYDIHSSMFIYYSGGTWVHRASLPSRYSNYDLYSGYKVVMVDYQGNTPYTNFPQYKKKYSRRYNGGNQQTIGEHPGKGNDNGNHDAGHDNGNNNQGHRKNGKSKKH